MLLLAGLLLMGATVTVLMVRGSKRTQRVTEVRNPVVLPPVIVNTSVFYPHTLIQDGLLTPAGPIVNSATFYTHTITAPGFLSAATLTNSATFYTHSLGQKLVANVLTNSSTFYTHSIVSASNALQQQSPVSNSPTFFTHFLKQQLRPGLLSNTATFYPHFIQAAGTPGMILSTPSVTLTTLSGEIPEIIIGLNADHYAGYYLRIQRSATGTKNVSDGSYASPTLNITHMITADEFYDQEIVKDSLIPDGYIEPASGVQYWQQYRIEREDGAISNWGTEITDTVSAATTALYTAAGGVGTFNKKSYLYAEGTPALTARGTATVGSLQSVRCTNPKTGKRQFEATITTLTSILYVGLEDGTTDLNSGFPGPGITNTKGVALRVTASGYDTWKAGSMVSSGSNANQVGDVISVEFDTTAGTCSFYRTRSGTTIQLGTTLTGISLSSWNAYCGLYDAGKWTMNFGQSAFARTLSTGYLAYG